MSDFPLLTSANFLVLSGPGVGLIQGMVDCGGTCSVESKFHLLSDTQLTLT